MNLRSVQVHGLLLVVILIAAWWATHSDDSTVVKDDKGVVLVQAAAGDAEALVYDTEESSLRLEARKDERGAWYYGKQTKRTKVEPPADDDAPTEDGKPGDDEAAIPTPEPDIVEEVVHFRGGSAAASLFEQLTPLKALRIIEDLSAEKREELGLDETSGSLTIVIRGKEHSFALGDKAYGSSDNYALTEDGRAVVLARALTGDLAQGERRFRERKLLEAHRSDIEGLGFSEGSNKLEISQYDRSEPGKAFWARAGEEVGDADLKDVVDKLLSLQADTYLPEGSEPGSPVLQVQVKKEGKLDDTLTIFSAAVTGDDGQPVTGFRARTGYSRLVTELDTKRVEALLAALDNKWDQAGE